MTRPFVSIVEISTLHDVLAEIKSLFSFHIFNFINTKDFLHQRNNNNLNVLSSIIISKKSNNFLLSSKAINSKDLILIDAPIRIDQLIDKINIFLIKKKYEFQSQLNIKNYIVNLNTKTISNNLNSLKLTEREIDIILFLKEKDLPQSVITLQSEVWNYSAKLETHTVETHIYRLRKKIKNQFNDEDFILSLKDGYLI